MFFKTELLTFDLDQLIQESLSIKQRLQKETQQTQEKVYLNPSLEVLAPIIREMSKNWIWCNVNSFLNWFLDPVFKQDNNIIEINFSEVKLLM